MCGSLPFHFKQAQCVEDVIRIRGGKLGGQKLGGGTVQHRGRGLFHVYPMLANALLEASNVLAPGD